jgi:hypothetical protein
MRGAIPPLTHTPSWRGAQLKGKESQFSPIEINKQYAFSTTISSMTFKKLFFFLI